ncbi:MAG: cell division protein FtsQ/DivIB [bacterium]|nr:cell division protein FtsQ/DivIB [bacterium]
MLIRRNNFKINRLGSSRKKYIYSAKAYRNPFFQNKRTANLQPGVLKNKSKLAIFAAIVVISILIWLLFFSTLFKIQNIEVSGVKDSLVVEIELIAKDLAENRLIGKNNLLLYNKNYLSEILNEKYYLDNLTIKRKFFHTLTINLREKQQVAVWRENEQYYYIDGDGNIINQTDPLNLNSSNYPLVENLTGINIDERKANINKEAIDYILNLFDEFKEKKHNFEIERFIIDKDVNTIKMAILSGPKIYFNIKASVEEQTAKLDLIIKDKLKNDFKTIKEYIDLRYANNVYMK